MRSSMSGLWGAGGGGGAVIIEERMESKWEERVWRPGSRLMEGSTGFFTPTRRLQNDISQLPEIRIKF